MEYTAFPQNGGALYCVVCMESSPPPFYAARPSILSSPLLPHTLSVTVLEAVRQMLQMQTEIPSQRIVGLIA